MSKYYYQSTKNNNNSFLSLDYKKYLKKILNINIIDVDIVNSSRLIVEVELSSNMSKLKDEILNKINNNTTTPITIYFQLLDLFFNSKILQILLSDYKKLQIHNLRD